MSMHPWTSHEVANLRHQERAVRAEARNAVRELEALRKTERSEQRRTRMEGLLASVHRRLSSAGVAVRHS
jgi:hypothetical protein